MLDELDNLDSINELNDNLSKTEESFNRVNSASKKTGGILEGTSDRMANVGASLGVTSKALTYLGTVWGQIITRAANKNEKFAKKQEKVNDLIEKVTKILIKGMVPVLMVMADSLTSLLTTLNEYPGVLELVGAGFAILLAALTALAVHQAVVTAGAATHAMMLQVVEEATWLYNGAVWALNAAQNALARATEIATAEQGVFSAVLEAASASAWLSNAATWALAAAQGALTTATAIASTALGVLNTVMLASPIFPFMAAILAVCVAMELLKDTEVGEWLRQLGGEVSAIIGQFASMVPTIDQVLGFLGQLVGLDGKPKGLVEWGMVLISVLNPIIPLTRAILDHFGLLDDVSAVLKSMAKGLSDFVHSLFDGVKRLVSNPKAMLTAFANAGVGFIKAMAKGLITGGLAILPNALGTALSAVLPFLPSSDAETGPLSNLVASGVALVKTIASGIFSADKAIASAVLSVLSGVLGGLGKAALSLGSEVAHGIASGIKGAAGAIGGAVHGVLNGAQGAVDAVANTVSATDAVPSAMNAVDTATGAVGQFAGNVADGVGGSVSGLAGAVSGGENQVRNSTQVHFHGEVHDVEKVDRQVRKAQRQAIHQAQRGIEDALDIGTDGVNSLI